MDFRETEQGVCVGGGVDMGEVEKDWLDPETNQDLEGGCC